ncbi:unnamed protein product [Peniophora sp. CBMAI 1063]|nr:unnamed protein product [Peniophora sp. CBMAI 1063]
MTPSTTLEADAEVTRARFHVKGLTLEPVEARIAQGWFGGIHQGSPRRAEELSVAQDTVFEHERAAFEHGAKSERTSANVEAMPKACVIATIFAASDGAAPEYASQPQDASIELSVTIRKGRTSEDHRRSLSLMRSRRLDPLSSSRA